MSELVLLCGSGASSAAVANALVREFGPIPILVERKESRSVFLRRRVKRMGIKAVAGQVAFTALIAPLLRRISRRRIDEIVATHRLDLERTALNAAMRVESVNSPEALDWLVRQSPRVVVVNGTRIIARNCLEATDAIFINTHCGITPQYRGAHGGYWALYAGDADNEYAGDAQRGQAAAGRQWCVSRDCASNDGRTLGLILIAIREHVFLWLIVYFSNHPRASSNLNLSLTSACVKRSRSVPETLTVSLVL